MENATSGGVQAVTAALITLAVLTPIVASVVMFAAGALWSAVRIPRTLADMSQAEMDRLAWKVRERKGLNG
jgi:hypothetical protein